MDLIGGRAIHPVNVRLGGFYSVPTRADLAPMAERAIRNHDPCISCAAHFLTLTRTAG
jgi:sulfhydrogenase subunit alpha